MVCVLDLHEEQRCGAPRIFTNKLTFPGGRIFSCGTKQVSVLELKSSQTPSLRSPDPRKKAPPPLLLNGRVSASPVPHPASHFQSWLLGRPSLNPLLLTSWLVTIAGLKEGLEGKTMPHAGPAPAVHFNTRLLSVKDKWCWKPSSQARRVTTVLIC